MRDYPLIKDIKMPKNFSFEEHGVTQSIVSIFENCKRKFLFKINRWGLNIEKKVFQYGKAGHGILDQMYRFGQLIKLPPTRERIAFFTESYFKNLPKKELYELDSQFLEIDKFRLIAVLSAYAKKYKADFTTRTYVSIEEPFKVNFKNWILCGVMDAKFKWIKEETILEHKFLGRIQNEDDMVELADMLFQLKFYAFANLLIKGVPTNSCMYNIIRKTSTKPHKATKKQKSESIVDYMIRHEKEINDNPSYFFSRYQTTYSPLQSSNFQKELDQKITEMQLTIENKRPIYPEESSCIAQYGICPYLHACSLGKMDNTYKQYQHISPELHRS